MPRRKKRFIKDSPEWVRNLFRLRLELEYQRNSGDSFQGLFDRIMRSIHADDFVSTAAIGREGDLGCDGYVQSRRVCFAVYGPDSSFNLKAARAKLRKDFSRFQDCWPAERRVSQWTFVVNHPGTHPSLTQLLEDLTDESGLSHRTTIWNRRDLTQQLFLYGQREFMEVEFGPVETKSRNVPPIAIVPEDNFVPSPEILVLHRLLWARLTCNEEEYGRLNEQYFEQVTADPWTALLASHHLLASAVIYAALEGLMDPLRIQCGKLLSLAPLHDPGPRRIARFAWNALLKVIFSDSYKGPDIHVGDNLGRLAEMALMQPYLILGVIRHCFLQTNKFETAVLEEIWTVAMDFKMRRE